MKYSVCCVIFFLGSTYGMYVQSNDTVYKEAPCTIAQGTCLKSIDCPPSHLADNPDLCPQQKPRGVVCCHFLTTQEQRCQSRGGGCMKSCNPIIEIKDKDIECPDNRKCCLLL